MRRKVKSKKSDKARFTRTATKIKAVNLPNRVYRGGIRF